MPDRRSILTVNAGSSSVRLAMYVSEPDGLDARSQMHFESNTTNPHESLNAFLAEHPNPQPDIVAHRVVHGGSRLTRSCGIDAEVEAEIERVMPLAPLHNPIALAWIRACRNRLGPQVRQLAVFDTAFYADLPDVAVTYGLPRNVSKRLELRRYGFHGLAHQALWLRWRELRPDIPDGGRVISFQLGSGCSVTATSRGRALDTSMGFSPLEGLMMATRSGDIDPSLVTYLQHSENLSAHDVERMLNERCGLLGVSGVSGDMRTLLLSDDPDARLAIELYCYRARKYLGAYLAVLGGADAILFGGGVGENAPSVRNLILAPLGWTGLLVDHTANASIIGGEGKVSTFDSRIEAW